MARQWRNEPLYHIVVSVRHDGNAMGLNATLCDPRYDLRRQYREWRQCGLPTVAAVVAVQRPPLIFLQESANAANQVALVASDLRPLIHACYCIGTPREIPLQCLVLAQYPAWACGLIHLLRKDRKRPAQSCEAVIAPIYRAVLMSRETWWICWRRLGNVCIDVCMAIKTVRRVLVPARDLVNH